MKCGVVAIAKNEENYIKEWIAHYKAFGFDKIIVGNNDSTDKTSEILESLQKKETIEYHDWPSNGKHPQIPFYNFIIEKESNNLDIILIVDVDEFLFSEDGDNPIKVLEDIFQKNQEISAIAINWCMFGSSGELTYSEKPLMERFKKHGDQKFGPNMHYKCAIRPKKIFSMLNPHHPAIKEGIISDTDGMPLKYLNTSDKIKFGLSRNVKFNRLRLNHYFCKSLQEFEEIKIKRGLADGPGVRTLNHFHAHDINTNSNFDIEHHIDTVKKIMIEMEK